MGIFNIVVFAVLLALSTAKNHSVQWGSPSRVSMLAYNYNVKGESLSRFLWANEKNVTYPPEGLVNTNTIYAIKAIDQNNDGHGAKASIVAGGIDQKSVTILFTAHIGHGIDYVLKIYTRACDIK